MMITNGTVTIEDGKKKSEEYAPARKVSVSISFSVDEGADSDTILSQAGDLANQHVSRLLTKNAAPVNAIATATAAVAEKPAAPKKEKAPAKTKADLAKEANVPATDTVHKAATDEELLEDEPTITADGKVVEDDLNDLNDLLGDLLGDSAPTPITDLELANAVQKKNAERKEADPNWAPAKIRDVISEYSGGKRVNDIPAAKRAEFLKKIEALK